MGQSRVGRALVSALERKHYTVLNHVILPRDGGTMQLDHVVISKFGIIVIMTEFHRGWISGTEFQEQWTKSRFKRSAKFPNPMHENYLNVQMLARILQLPDSKIHSIVVFTGHRGFKQSMPGNVLPAEKVIPYIRRRRLKILTEEQTTQALARIDRVRLGFHQGVLADTWVLLRLILIVTLIAGAWVAFDDELAQWVGSMKEGSDKRLVPEKFHPDGRLKSKQELWQDSLICAWSTDTGRCSCYEPGGSRVQLALEKCRSLAEKGSILKQ